MTSPRPAGEYGIDAPWVPWMFVGLAALYVAITALAATVWESGVALTVLFALMTLAFAACAWCYWHTTRTGKFAVWAELLSDTSAPERAVDLGCGRGAVAIQTARAFPGARVDGVDLWRSVDQSGNSPDAAIANARANRVDDRIVFTTGDMTALPYDDASFDLATASVSIHNIPTAEGRARAVDEAWRVLRPGGRLLIADISKTDEYVQTLTAAGAAHVESRPAGWRMWWSGPWMATRIVSARKPG